MNSYFQSGRASVKSFIFYLLVAIGIVAYWQTGNEVNTNPVSSGVSRAAPASNVRNYALRSADNSWPNLSGEQAGNITGADLLTENFYVLLDGSGSMKDIDCSDGRSKMEAALKALFNFSHHVPKSANFGFSVFINNQNSEIIPLGPAGQVDYDKLSIRITPGGSTPLRSSIEFAYRKLVKQGQKQLGYGKYHLIIITDGIASKGEDPTPVINRILAESPVNLHTIGFCIGTEHVLNQSGRTIYHAADNPAELTRGLESVLAEAPQFDISGFSD